MMSDCIVCKTPLVISGEYVCCRPLGPQLDQLLGLIVPSHRLHLKASTTSGKAHQYTALLVNLLCTCCTPNKVYLHPFHTDTTGPLSRVYNLPPTTNLLQSITLHLVEFTSSALPRRITPFSYAFHMLLHCWRRELSHWYTSTRWVDRFLTPWRLHP